MKKLFIVLIIFVLSLLAISCLEDLDTGKKKDLFIFFDNMKTQILDDNINWIEKNSNIDNIESIKDILTDNKDSIKNLLSSLNGEYSVTINYTIGDNTSAYRGYYIIRNSEFSPTYYYIRLINEANKWKIESIDRLPLR
ncbi:hypothetical protein [Brachyspira innocens]|uniref:hypothetical protein n=1 Tax=Brachyspira innocens TaxID=13264 RepID=UPI0026EFA98F|nr:hypothetical protein [Brachyspira innocens]